MLTYESAMPAEKYHSLIKDKLISHPGYAWHEYPLHYQSGEWQLLKVTPKEINPGDKVIVLRGTIHGDEIAGSLTLLNYFDDILNYANDHGVKVIIYCIGNPSGFEKGLRYNVDNDKGDGNNDFMRYLAPDGSVVEDPVNDSQYARWLMSDDPTLNIHLPLESKLMLELVRQDPVAQIVAALDLHQDYLTENLPPVAYHYAFGDLKRFIPIVDRIKQHLPVLAHFDMNAGYNEQIDDQGNVIPRTAGGGFISDDYGFIVRHDASMSDWYDRVGVKISIASETSGVTPIDTACLVNWIWITGVIDLVTA